MVPRVLEPEVMDSAGEARDYDAMDHSEVNRVFVADFLSFWPGNGAVLDLGTGTAQIPIELCRRHGTVQVVAVGFARHILQLAPAHFSPPGLCPRTHLQNLHPHQPPLPQPSLPPRIFHTTLPPLPPPHFCF